MNLSELTKRLGMAEYPESLNPYYPLPEGRENELCSMELIDRLQEKFNLFDTYYEEVKKGWEEILLDEDRKTFVDVVTLCIRDSDVHGSRKMKYPKTNGTSAGNMLPLYPLLSSVEEAFQEYIDRGFSEEHARTTMNGFLINLQVVENHITGFKGLTSTYANWLCLYIKCRIFYHGGLNYEIHSSPSYNPFILRNKKDGSLAAVFGNNFPIHQNGIPLGSGGAMEEEGSFISTFEENDRAYVGHLSHDYIVDREKTVFPKEEWELVHRPGDHDLSVHIPRQTDFSPEAVSKSMEEALELVEKCYPEWKPKAFYCSSWLLSPVLDDVLGENSKICRFSNLYFRFPRKSGGMSPFGYAFPKHFESFESLPENTSLQRGLKKKYLEGAFVYDTSGIILLD